jgi:hypothetical protein
MARDDFGAASSSTCAEFDGRGTVFRMVRERRDLQG